MFITASASLDPYISQMDAVLSRVGHTLVFLSLFVALLVKANVSDERDYSAEVFDAVLIAVNALTVLAVITETLFGLYTSFGTEGDRIREDSPPRTASMKDRRGDSWFFLVTQQFRGCLLVEGY